MNTITLRTATADDAEMLLDIYAYYVQNTAITFEYEVPTVSDFRGRISAITDRYPYIIAFLGDTPIGYAYASRFKERAAYNWAVETSIYVRHDMHGCGIGRLLYTVLCRDLHEMGVINVNACIAYAGDCEDEYLTNGSVFFHEKMGFKCTAHFHRCGYKYGRWYDMVWMEKILSDYPDEPKPLKKPVFHR